MRLVSTADTHTVVADGYQAYVRAGATAVVLADPHGRAWSRPSLLASLDRTDCADESYDVQPLHVTERPGIVEFVLRAASPPPLCPCSAASRRRGRPRTAVSCWNSTTTGTPLSTACSRRPRWCSGR